MRTQTEQLNEHIRCRAMAYIARQRADRAGVDERRRFVFAAIVALPFAVLAFVELWRLFR